jgi:hypothetical protein
MISVDNHRDCMHELYDKYAFALEFSNRTTTCDTLAVDGVHYDRLIGPAEGLREYGFVTHEIDARRRCYVFALPGDGTGAVYMFVGRMNARGDTSNFVLYGICDRRLVMDAATGLVDDARLGRFLRRKNRVECVVPTQTSRFSVFASPLRYTVLGKPLVYDIQFYPGRQPSPHRTCSSYDMEVTCDATDSPPSLIQPAAEVSTSVTRDSLADRLLMPPPAAPTPKPKSVTQVDLTTGTNVTGRSNRRKGAPVMHVPRDMNRANNKRRRLNQTRMLANARHVLVFDDDEECDEDDYEE